MLNATPGVIFHLAASLPLKPTQLFSDAPPANLWNSIEPMFDPDTRPSYSDTAGQTDIVGQYSRGVYTFTVRALPYGRLALLTCDLPFHRLHAHPKRLHQSKNWVAQLATLSLLELQKIPRAKVQLGDPNVPMDEVAGVSEPNALAHEGTEALEKVPAGSFLPDEASSNAEYKHFFPISLSTYDQLFRSSALWDEHIVDSLLNTRGHAKIVIGVEDDGFVTGVRLPPMSLAETEGTMQAYARAVCLGRICPPLALTTSCKVTLLAVDQSVPSEMTNPIYTLIPDQRDGLVHSLVHLVFGRAAVVPTSEDGDEVMFICQEADLTAVKMDSFLADFRAMPHDPKRRESLHAARQHALSGTWDSVTPEMCTSLDVQHALLITIDIEKRSTYGGFYWVETKPTLSGGTRFPVALTRGRTEPAISALRAPNAWLRVRTAPTPVLLQLQSEFFTKILYSDKQQSAYPHIQFRAAFTPKDDLSRFRHEVRAHSRSYIIIIDVADIDAALIMMYSLVAPSATGQPGLRSTFCFLVIAHIEDDFLKFVGNFHKLHGLPNTTIDIYPELSFSDADEHFDGEPVSSSSPLVPTPTACLLPIQVDHSRTLDELQARALDWLSYSDPYAMSWELVAKGFIVSTHQVRTVARTVLSSTRGRLGLVKQLRGSGASALLRCVGYELKTVFNVYLVVDVPPSALLQHLLDNVAEKVLLLCDEDVSFLQVEKQIAMLPSVQSAKIFLLYVRNRQMTQLASSEIPVNPLLTPDDARAFCHQLAYVFPDSRAALDQALLASKPERPEDTHIFIFALTACRGRYLPATRMAEACFEAAKANRLLEDAALLLAFFQSFIWGNAVINLPFLTSDDVPIPEEFLLVFRSTDFLDHNWMCCHPFFARLFLQCARPSLDFSRQWLDQNALCDLFFSVCRIVDLRYSKALAPKLFSKLITDVLLERTRGFGFHSRFLTQFIEQPPTEQPPAAQSRGWEQSDDKTAEVVLSLFKTALTLVQVEDVETRGLYTLATARMWRSLSHRPNKPGRGRELRKRSMVHAHQAATELQHTASLNLVKHYISALAGEFPEEFPKERKDSLVFLQNHSDFPQTFPIVCRYYPEIDVTGRTQPNDSFLPSPACQPHFFLFE